MLKNLALKTIIGIDFESLTEGRDYQPKIFTLATQKDFAT